MPAIVRIANHLLANKNGEEMATLEPGLDGISQLQTHFFFSQGEPPSSWHRWHRTNGNDKAKRPCPDTRPLIIMVMAFFFWAVQMLMALRCLVQIDFQAVHFGHLPFCNLCFCKVRNTLAFGINRHWPLISQKTLSYAEMAKGT